MFNLKKLLGIDDQKVNKPQPATTNIAKTIGGFANNVRNEVNQHIVQPSMRASDRYNVLDKDYWKPTTNVRVRDVVRQIPNSIVPTSKKVGNFGLDMTLRPAARTAVQVGNIVAPNTISKDFLQDPNQTKTEKFLFGQTPGTVQDRVNFNKSYAEKTGLKGGYATTAALGMTAMGSVLDVTGGGKNKLASSLAKASNAKAVTNLLQRAGKTVDANTVKQLVKETDVNKVGELLNPAKKSVPTTSLVPKIHPDDQNVMTDFIAYTKGTYRPDPKTAHRLELDASRIAEHYKLNANGMPRTTKELAGNFNKVVADNGQSAFGGVAGLEPQYDENGEITGYKFNPVKAALGVGAMMGVKKVGGITPKAPTRNEGIKLEAKELAKELEPLSGKVQNMGTARKLITGGDKILKRSGVGGVKLEEAIQAQRKAEDLLRGRWNVHIDTALEGLSKDELANVDAVLRGEAKPINAKTAGASKSLRNWFNKIGKEAETKGFEIQTKDGVKTPFKMREDYAPQMYQVSEFKKGKRRAEALQHLVDTGQSRNLGEATQLLDNFIVQNAERRFGNLEKAREINLPGFIRDPKVYAKKYAESIAKRFTEVEHFGAKDSKAAEYINKIAQEGGDYGEAQRIFDFTTKGAPQNKAVSAVTQFNLATQLDLSAITNATQSLNTASKAGIVNTVKGAAKGFTKEGKKIANEAGVYDNLVNIQEQGVDLHRVVKAVLWPFQQVENFNRRTAANTGVIRAQQLAEKEMTDYTMRALKDLGIDPTSIKNGKLSKDQLLSAAYELTRRTQFKVNPVDVPPAWKTPVGRLATQFQSFSFMQTKFIRDEILGEAKKGNFAPIARFIPLAIAGSYAANYARNFVTGRDPKEANKNMDIRAWDKWGKAFGDFATGKIIQGKFLYDTYTNDYNTPLTKVTRTLSSIGGPTVGKVGNILTGLEAIPAGIEKNTKSQISIAKGEKKATDPYLQLKRYAAGEIPFVGEYTKNKAFAFPKSQYSAEQKNQFAKDEFNSADKVISIGLSRGTITQKEADKQRSNLQKEYQKSTGTNASSVSGQTSDKRIQKDSNGFSFMDSKGDWVSKDTLKGAQTEVAKMDFEASDKPYEVKDGMVYTRNTDGTAATPVTELKFSYDLGKEYLQQYKDNDDLGSWLKTAQSQYDNIKEQLKSKNLDPRDVIALQNDAQTLVNNMAKYKGYGGFTKGKSAAKKASMERMIKMLETTTSDNLSNQQALRKIVKGIKIKGKKV